MQGRRVGGERAGIRAGGVVQALDERSVVGRRAAAERVARLQRRQPDPLDPLLEGCGVRHGQAVARHAVLVVHDAADGVG